MKYYSGEGKAFMVRVASNNSMQRTALRAAADAERSKDRKPGQKSLT